MTDRPRDLPPVVPCPTCRRPVEFVPANRWRPFCSERCRAIDLGAWAAESYAIPADAPRDDDLEGDGGTRRGHA